MTDTTKKITEEFTLLNIISEIREALGVGEKLMLTELADEVRRLKSLEVRLFREPVGKVVNAKCEFPEMSIYGHMYVELPDETPLYAEPQILESQEPVYICGKGWQIDAMPKHGTPLYLNHTNKSFRHSITLTGKGSKSVSIPPIGDKITTCKKCGGEMKQGKALEQNFSGTPDFAGDDYVCTVSPDGTADLIDCMKCVKCGWSMT